MKLRFHLSKEVIEKLPAEDYEVIEMIQDGEMKLYRLRPLLARLMVGEDGKPIPFDVAKKKLGMIPVAEWGDVVNQFVNSLKESMVPNMSGDLSEPLSEVKPPSESPAGSEQ